MNTEAPMPLECGDGDTDPTAEGECRIDMPMKMQVLDDLEVEVMK